jgi:hypothetical protein
VVRWFATATDIEERKQAEDRMRNETVALREAIVRSDGIMIMITGRCQHLSLSVANLDAGEWRMPADRIRMRMVW